MTRDEFQAVYDRGPETTFALVGTCSKGWTPCRRGSKNWKTASAKTAITAASPLPVTV
jgi:hypothetical protein